MRSRSRDRGPARWAHRAVVTGTVEGGRDGFEFALPADSATGVIAKCLGTASGNCLGRSQLADRLFLNRMVVGMNVPAMVIAMLCYICLGLNGTALIVAVALMAGLIAHQQATAVLVSHDPR